MDARGGAAPRGKTSELLASFDADPADKTTNQDGQSAILIAGGGNATDRTKHTHFCFNTPMAGSRREVKLPYRELNIACPRCRAPLIIGTVLDRIAISRRTCPKCGKEFLIENDVAKKPDGGVKKPSESVKPVRAVKRTKAR